MYTKHKPIRRGEKMGINKAIKALYGYLVEKQSSTTEKKKKNLRYAKMRYLERQ